MASRTVIGVGCLRKEQLQYELKLRGQSEEGDVGELAARLRGALSLPVQVSAERVGEVSAEVQSCTTSLSELHNALDFLAGSCPSRTQVYRLQAQIAHWINRVGDLCSVVTDPEIKRTINDLQAKVMQAQVKLSAVEWNRNANTNEPEGEQAGMTSELPRGSARVVGDDDQNYFAKLPNPILNVFRQVERVGIDTIEDLVRFLWFLVDLEKQVSVFRVPSQVALQLLYPLCKGSLGDIVSLLVEEQRGLSELRARVLASRLSARLRSELINKYLFRVQHQGETVAHYVGEVRTAATALDVNISEGEVVTSIIQGLCPEDRSRVVFGKEPATFRELEELLVKIEGVRQGDMRRAREERYSVNDRKVGSPRDNGVERVNQCCFRCGKKGHLARSCRGTTSNQKDS